MKEIDVHHQKLYAEEAGRYDDRRFSSRRGQLCDYYEKKSLMRLLSPLEGVRILDVPAGTGRITEALIEKGADVVAADLTPAMLMTAQRKLKNKYAGSNHILPFCSVNANARQLPFPDHSFDRVISIRFLHLIPPEEWPKFLVEMRRVMKPDGQLVVQIFNPLYGGGVGLLRELYRHARKEPGECFIWPHQLKPLFAEAGLAVTSVSSYWLPGMGFFGRPGSAVLECLTRVCAVSPLKWIAGPYNILAQAG